MLRRRHSIYLAFFALVVAGTVAEEMIFQDVSTGAENDLSRATEIARSMVTRTAWCGSAG